MLTEDVACNGLFRQLEQSHPPIENHHNRVVCPYGFYGIQ